MLDLVQTSETNGLDSTMREALDVLNIGLAIYDSSLCLVTFNKAYIDLLSFPTDLCRPGTTLEATFRFKAERGEYGPGDVETIVAERLALARKFEPHSYERARPDGTVFKVEGHPLPSGGFVTTYTDVTEISRARKALEEKEQDLIRHLDDLEMERAMTEQQAQQIVEMAETLAAQNKEIEEDLKQTDFEAKHDTLTGLPNRRFFLAHLQQALGNAQQLGMAKALLFIDLDNFKPINDTLGHDRGDQLLRDVAKALRKSVRDSDFVARLGGDEFAVIASVKPENGANGVRILAERIASALTIAVESPDGIIVCSASVGVSLFPNDSSDLEGCLAMADNAMYAAKRAGRNCVVFASEAEKSAGEAAEPES